MPTLSLDEIKRVATAEYIKRSTSKNFQTTINLEDGRIYNLISTMVDSISASLTGGGGGEANTASNIGAGNGIFAQKVGVDLQLKSLIAGSNIGITQSASALSISASSGSSSISGLDRTYVRVASNIDYSLVVGWTIIDSVSLNDGDRVLLKNQSNTRENGIYVHHSDGSHPRATDADSWDELLGSVIFVEEGSVNNNTAWVCNSLTGGTVGASAITYIEMSNTGQANTMSNTGTGEGLIYKEKIGDNLIVKSIKAGSNVTITNNTNEIIISAVSVAVAVSMYILQISSIPSDTYNFTHNLITYLI